MYVAEEKKQTNETKKQLVTYYTMLFARIGLFLMS